VGFKHYNLVSTSHYGLNLSYMAFTAQATKRDPSETPQARLREPERP
jgi:hypothetical protein